MKYKLIVFDLDGTLLDTLEDLADSTNHALVSQGQPARSLEEVRCFVGNGIRKLIERAVSEGCSPDVTEAIFEEFKTHYGVHCNDRTHAYDGIMELLAALRQNHYRLAVVSNKADFAVQSLCQLYFKGMLDVAVGEKEGIRRKPAPDMVDEVLRIMNVDRSDAVYIGDSDVDIATARNAGMDCISVTWGFRSENFLKEHGAEVLVDKPKELLRFL